MDGEVLEQWAGVWRYLAERGLVFRDSFHLRSVWEASGMPVTKRAGALRFSLDSVSEFMRRAVGVTMERWMEQSAEDEALGRTPRTIEMRDFDGPTPPNRVWCVTVRAMDGRVERRLARLRDGTAFVTRHMDVAETWDTTPLVGRPETWRFDAARWVRPDQITDPDERLPNDALLACYHGSGFDMAHIATIAQSHFLPSRGPMLGGERSDGPNLLTKCAFIVGELSPEERAAVVAAMGETAWILHTDPVPVALVTLDVLGRDVS